MSCASPPNGSTAVPTVEPAPHDGERDRRLQGLRRLDSSSGTVDARVTPRPRLAADGVTVAPLVELGADVLGRPQAVELEHLAGSRAVAGRPLRMSSSTCGGTGAPASSAARRAAAQPGPSTGPRNAAPEPHGLPRAGRARADDVERTVDAAQQRLDHRPGRVLLVEEHERRVGERRHRHERAAAAAGRAGSGRASRPRAPGAAPPPGSRGGGPSVGGQRLDLEARAPVRRRGRERRVLRRARPGDRARGRRPRGRCAPRPVRAGPCPPPRLERGAPCTPACTRPLRAAAQPRVGLVDAEVGDGVGRELGDELGELLAVARVDPSELAAPQPAARGHEVARRRSRVTSSRSSSSWATRVPSSPPMPVTSTRIRPVPVPRRRRRPRGEAGGRGSPHGSTTPRRAA